MHFHQVLKVRDVFNIMIVKATLFIPKADSLLLYTFVYKVKVILDH